MSRQVPTGVIASESRRACPGALTIPCRSASLRSNSRTFLSYTESFSALRQSFKRRGKRTCSYLSLSGPPDIGPPLAALLAGGLVNALPRDAPAPRPPRAPFPRPPAGNVPLDEPDPPRPVPFDTLPLAFDGPEGAPRGAACLVPRMLPRPRPRLLGNDIVVVAGRFVGIRRHVCLFCLGSCAMKWFR